MDVLATDHNNTTDHINSSDKTDGSPIGSSSRTKLSFKDIRLILYLIINIKPFKYIGDRSMNQTKKWKMIQHKYKLMKDPTDRGTVVPTIRTLQRQLSGAVRKAKYRKKDRPSAEPLFKSITTTSSLPEMEQAVLELYELSDTLKNGKIVDSSLLECCLSQSADAPRPASAAVSALALSDQGTITTTTTTTTTDSMSYKLMNDLERSCYEIELYMASPFSNHQTLVDLVQHLQAKLRTMTAIQQDKLADLHRERQVPAGQLQEINAKLVDQMRKFLALNSSEDLINCICDLINCMCDVN